MPILNDVEKQLLELARGENKDDVLPIVIADSFQSVIKNPQNKQDQHISDDDFLKRILQELSYIRNIDGVLTFANLNGDTVEDRLIAREALKVELAEQIFQLSNEQNLDDAKTNTLLGLLKRDNYVGLLDSINKEFKSLNVNDRNFLSNIKGAVIGVGNLLSELKTGLLNAIYSLYNRLFPSAKSSKNPATPDVPEMLDLGVPTPPPLPEINLMAHYKPAKSGSSLSTGAPIAPPLPSTSKNNLKGQSKVGQPSVSLIDELKRAQLKRHGPETITKNIVSQENALVSAINDAMRLRRAHIEEEPKDIDGSSHHLGKIVESTSHKPTTPYVLPPQSKLAGSAPNVSAIPDAPEVPNMTIPASPPMPKHNLKKPAKPEAKVSLIDELKRTQLKKRDSKPETTKPAKPASPTFMQSMLSSMSSRLRDINNKVDKAENLDDWDTASTPKKTAVQYVASATTKPASSQKSEHSEPVLSPKPQGKSQQRILADMNAAKPKQQVKPASHLTTAISSKTPVSSRVKTLTSKFEQSSDGDDQHQKGPFQRS